MYSFNTIRSKFNICGGVIDMQNQLRNNILSMSGSKNKQEKCYQDFHYISEGTIYILNQI